MISPSGEMTVIDNTTSLTSPAPAFDYTQLEDVVREQLREKEQHLAIILKRTRKEIGQVLLEVKEILPHGMFEQWYRSKGLSKMTAWRCMQEAQGKEIQKYQNDTFLAAAEVKSPEIDDLPQVPVNTIDDDLFFYNMRTPSAQCTPEQCAINNVLWTGQIFTAMRYKQRLAWHEVTWFAMSEFMLTPVETAWHMHYALRYPGRRGGVEAQDVQAILQLDLNTHGRITRRVVRIVMEQAYNLSFLYECQGIRNIEERYHVPDHVAAKLFTMLAEYYALPLEAIPPGWDTEEMSLYAMPNYEDIPEDIISGCIDIWDKYVLDIPMPDLCQEAAITRQPEKKKVRAR